MLYFSVIIPTFNRAAFIEQAVKSTLQQNFEDFEVIVIDDGSTDDTERIVQGIKDTRLIYHKKENEERAVARNIGTQLSRGKYVTFLDSDDVLYENHLSTAFQFIDSTTSRSLFILVMI